MSDSNNSDDPSPLDEVEHRIEDNVQWPYPVISGDDRTGEQGKLFERQLRARSQAILNRLDGLLPSNYRSQIPSNEYSFFMRAMSQELARLTMILESVREDVSFRKIRSEFLYDVVGNLLFVGDKIPDVDWNDEQFRNFLLRLIDVYFQGSTPESIRDAIELFLDEEDPPFEIRELYKDARQDQSNLDISNQFEFSVVFDPDDDDQSFPQNVFQLQRNVELILDIIRPAHTLYGLSHLFEEKVGLPEDEESLFIDDRRYEDVRQNCRGMSGWSSTSGKIKHSNFRRLYDPGEQTPFHRIQGEALLVVEEGTNRGEYRVTGTPDPTSSEANDWVEVYPQFDLAEDNVHYRVEVDLKGSNTEHTTTEDVTAQFGPSWDLSASVSDVQVRQGGSVDVKASTSYDSISSRLNLSFSWDLTGNGQYDDASGRQATFSDTSTAGQKQVRVRVEEPTYGKRAIGKGVVHVR